MSASLPARNEVNPDGTWNADSLFPTPEVWEAEVEAILVHLPAIKNFKGRLSDSATALADALKTQEELQVRGERAYLYAGFSYSVDTTDQQAAGMVGLASSMSSQLAASVSFIKPELLAIGEDTLMSWAQFGHLYRDYYV